MVASPQWTWASAVALSGRGIGADRAERCGSLARGGGAVARDSVRGHVWRRSTCQHGDVDHADGDLRRRAAAGQHGAPRVRARQPARDGAPSGSRGGAASSLARSEPRKPAKMTDEYGPAAGRRPGPGSYAAAAWRSSCARRGSARSSQDGRTRARQAPRLCFAALQRFDRLPPEIRTVGPCRRAAGSARACARTPARRCVPR